MHVVELGSHRTLSTGLCRYRLCTQEVFPSILALPRLATQVQCEGRNPRRQVEQCFFDGLGVVELVETFGPLTEFPRRLRTAESQDRSDGERCPI